MNLEKDIKTALNQIKEGKATITMSLIAYWDLLRQAKKEVFDDIDKLKVEDLNWFSIGKIQKKHLNTNNTESENKENGTTK